MPVWDSSGESGLIISVGGYIGVSLGVKRSDELISATLHNRIPSNEPSK
jgi:hypothetical protein